MFHALPRIGSNLSNLIVQCGSAVAAGAVEWIWLGTRLTPTQLAFAAITIIGIALGLAPTAVAAEPSSARRKLTPIIKTGVILAIISALAQGVGAVMSRKAFALAAKAYEPIDAGTAAFERVLGGLAIAAIALVISAVRRDAPLSAKSKAAVWVIANALTGPVLGVTCYQWALRTTPAGVVQPIVAAAPLLTIPFAAYFERSRPRLAYYVGACLAAAGVAGLALAR
jgi:drug/metabolite transporter (DMT)-like permease